MLSNTTFVNCTNQDPNTINLLDHGYIKFIEHWGSDERIIEAARMSTNKGFLGWEPEHYYLCPKCNNYSVMHEYTAVTCILCNTTMNHIPEKSHNGDEKLLSYLYKNKHSTPFEMAGLVIEVKAPIFIFREWHRHRTQSYNEMSARYVPLPNENYIPSIERLMEGANTATTNKQAQGLGNILTPEAALKWRQQLIISYDIAQENYEKGLAAGIPKELARLAVPVARYSKMRACANLRNWLAFLTLRQASAAQWEIRQYANAVGEIISQLFPKTWNLYNLERTK